MPLQVPLDYANSSAGFAGIAMIKYPAKVPSNSSAYKGPVIINPGEYRRPRCTSLPLAKDDLWAGGPGASGVTLVQTLGLTYQRVFGPEYDIVGFDAR